MTFAVLALQGAFIEHVRMVEHLGEECFEIRCLADLERPFDRLILPGGESTVQAKLLHDLGLFEPLRERITQGMPVLGTCAGLILLSERIDGTGDLDRLDASAAKARLAFEGFGTMPVAVRRNAYGRQLGSFYCEEVFEGLGTIPMTFIRAPYITEVAEGVQVLARVDDHIVAARASSQLGVAFHPELDDNPRVHELFLSL